MPGRPDASKVPKHQPRDYRLKLESAVSRFGAAVRPRLADVVGGPEDQLRGPFEYLLQEAGEALGLTVVMHGETSLSQLAVRPDYAVDVAGARVGYVELKRAGRGTDPARWPAGSHDRQQWEKLRALPNVLYGDGEEFSLYRSGSRSGKAARLCGDLGRAGAKLRPADGEFARIIAEFLWWEPERPRTTRQLVRAVAGLCRLLRDEVLDVLEREKTGQDIIFTSLADDWRGLLFPGLDGSGFANAYAQTLTFALLLARSNGIDFSDAPMPEIARQLGKTHSLMGKALDVMTDGTVERDSVVIETLRRVIGFVDWTLLEDANENSYALLYEHFLEEYDPSLRKASGSYYTPDDIAAFMVGFTDEILRRRLGRRRGFASPDVLVVDPAMGTGTFLTTIIDVVARTVVDEEGPGQVEPRLRELFRERLIGFERQVCPYAVAELRTHQALKQRHADVPSKDVRFLTDTLDNPDIQELHFGRMYDVLQRSRREANRIKREVPVMVVIGNPPYLERARGQAPWIEERGGGGRQRPSLDRFRSPGNGRFEYVLSNLYVYFWRWATWKVFDAHADEPAGVVAFVSTSGYTTGPGFAGMREYLRRTADEGWIIDLSPEGHQPDVNTRVFSGVQQPLCIGIFARYGRPAAERSARVHFTAVSGLRLEKFDQLKHLTLDSDQWRECSSGWRDRLLPPTDDSWTSFPALGDLFPWHAPGIKPNRTWVYAPLADTLRKRWARLVHAAPEEKPSLFKETSSSNLFRRQVPPLHGQDATVRPFCEETGESPDPVRVAYRSFDRQWIIPDARLIHRPSPDLWQVQSPGQVYITEQHAHPISSGPGLTFAALIPDMHHFNGRGGRVMPLYRDAAGQVPNVAGGLLKLLSHRIGVSVNEHDLLAYVACVVAHPAYTARFAVNLLSRGIRVPLTTDRILWETATELGRNVLWLHTYGEIYAEPLKQRTGPPLQPVRERPRSIRTISDKSCDMPQEISYDEPTQTIILGTGAIQPVTREVWQYEVAGMNIIKKWFGYRKRNPSGRRSSPLDDLNPDGWDPQLTTELLELLNVLGGCVALQSRQAHVLEQICGNPTISIADLSEAVVYPISPRIRKPLRPPEQLQIF